MNEAEKTKLTKDDVFTLIFLRGEKFAMYFSGRKVNHQLGWKLITRELGFKVEHHKKIKKKWENLLHKYRICKQRQKSETSAPVTWEFFQSMDDILKNTYDEPIPVPIELSDATTSDPPSTNFKKVLINAHSPRPAFAKERYTERALPVMDYNVAQYPTEQNPKAHEYFNGIKQNPAKRKPDDFFEYIKKRDKRIIKQNKMLLKLLRKDLERDGIDISSDSDSDF